MSGLSILLVDDDRVGRHLLGEGLARQFERVEQVDTAEAMFDWLAEDQFDVVVLDVNLPGTDGISAAGRLRARSDVGLIMVSVIHDPRTRVLAIESGADAYLVKPIILRELSARIQALGARVAAGRGRKLTPVHRPVQRGISLDVGARALRAGNLHEALTDGEMALLVCLLDAADSACSRDILLRCMSDSDLPESGNRSVDTLIGRLRTKLRALGASQDCLRSVRGVGYMLVANP